MAKKRKDPHAVALGRKGAKAGASKAGKARWEGVPPEERSAFMRRMVLARWKNAKRRTDRGP
jgi:hypothetical protein